MQHRFHNRTILIIAAVGLAIWGCSSTDDQVRRGSLKEAMEKSSDRYHGERKVADSRETQENRHTYLEWEHEQNCRRHRNETVYESPSSPPPRSRNETIYETPSSPPKTVDFDAGAGPRDSAHPKLVLPGEDRYAIPRVFFGHEQLDWSIVPADSTRSVVHHYLPWADSSRGIQKRSKDERREPPNCYVGARFLGGACKSPYYSELYGAGLALLFKTEEGNQHVVDFGGTALILGSGDALAGSVRNMDQFFLGYEYRYYLAWPRRFFGSLGGEVRLLLWDYNNPIRSDFYDDDGKFLRSDTVKDDGIGSFSGSVGLGFSMMKTEWFIANCELSAGASAYWGRTFSGFNNDLFKADLFIRAAFEIGIGVRASENKRD